MTTPVFGPSLPSCLTMNMRMTQSIGHAKFATHSTLGRVGFLTMAVRGSIPVAGRALDNPLRNIKEWLSITTFSDINKN